MAKYKVFRVFSSIKFFTLLMQKRDFEILEQILSMCSSKDKYSSRRTPRSLKLFVFPSLCILSIGDISKGSFKEPVSLLLNTT